MYACGNLHFSLIVVQILRLGVFPLSIGLLVRTVEWPYSLLARPLYLSLLSKDQPNIAVSCGWPCDNCVIKLLTCHACMTACVLATSLLNLFKRPCLFLSNIKDSAGLNTEAITLEVELTDFIPEWLPMHSCKVRVYHHGIKTQCNKCWELGHFFKDCQNPQRSWKGFAKFLFETGDFEREMFGYWLDETKEDQPGTSNQAKTIQDFLAKSQDLRQLVTLLQGAAKAENPKPKEKAKAQGKGCPKGPPKGGQKRFKLQKE